MAFFELQATEGRARAGVMHTAHGEVITPCFMPVGTQASVKALDSRDLSELHPPIILANTYHLMLRPGADRVLRLGGLHTFMNWPHPILTDSGGFQVFSLSQIRGSEAEMAAQPEEWRLPKLVSVDSDGVSFRSHLDGSIHRLTPESAIKIQHQLGADIIMAFDQCTRDDAPEPEALMAMIRTHEWAERCLDEFLRPTRGTQDYRLGEQRLFGIIQGGLHRDLRIESAKFITSLPFDGIAIGGETIGYNMEGTREVMDWIAPYLPEDKPRYTMGVGFSPRDLFDAVACGADMFDCVAPTRIARNGAVYTKTDPTNLDRLTLDITQSRYAEDTGPIDATCACMTCKTYTRAYLHHLFRAQELAAYRLATIHNVHFMLETMRKIRKAIQEKKFDDLRTKFLILDS